MANYKNRSYANRGSTFETIIEMANTRYENVGIAKIGKVPTPTQITKDNGKGIEGYKTKAEWVDFVGVIKGGQAIAFEAKETQSKTSIPLKNLQTHQYEFLKTYHEMGAHAFVLVSFRKHNEIYLLDFNTLQEAWEWAKKGGRESISYETFKNECQLVNVMEYLEALDY